MYCTNCGEKVSEKADVCIHCGVRIKKSLEEDHPNWVVNIITLCFVPLVGLVMYFVWKDEKPNAAKSALTFFFINIGLIVLFYIFIFLISLFSY